MCMNIEINRVYSVYTVCVFVLQSIHTKDSINNVQCKRQMNGCTYVFIIDVPFCTNIHSHKKALHSRFSETVKMEKEHVIRMNLALSSSKYLNFSKNHHPKFIKKHNFNCLGMAFEISFTLTHLS